MTNKPVWIICTRAWANHIMESECPLGQDSCPLDEDGASIGCTACWERYACFDIIDEEGDAE